MGFNLRRLVILRRWYILLRKIPLIVKLFFLSRLDRNNNFTPFDFKIPLHINTYIKGMAVNIFGDRIDFENVTWHVDLRSHHFFEIKFFAFYQLEHLQNHGFDIKYPWEVSRLYVLSRLSRLFSSDGGDVYYQDFKKLFLRWLQDNRFQRGVNWICSMEVSIRLINICFAVNAFAVKLEYDEAFNKIVNKTLLQHLSYIYCFPETGPDGRTANHALTNYVSLLFGSAMYREPAPVSEWKRTAINGILRCMDEQVHEDGVHFEGSIGYHKIVLELFIYAAMICLCSGVDLPVKFYDKLKKMLVYTEWYMDRSGQAPLLGDNDSGRIVYYDEYEENDHRYLTELGKVLFEKMSNTCHAPPVISIPSTLCEGHFSPPWLRHRAFPEGGAYVYKIGKFDLLICAHELGQYGRGGHNHYDTGSFVLSYEGKALIVDPGMFSYNSNLGLRFQLRNIESHNVAMTTEERTLCKSAIHPWILKPIWRIGEITAFDDSFRIEIIMSTSGIRKIRTFSFVSPKEILLEDLVPGVFETRFHFADNQRFQLESSSSVLINDQVRFTFNQVNQIERQVYTYAPIYYSARLGERLVISAGERILTRITSNVI
jgi:hypothetical protein